MRGERGIHVYVEIPHNFFRENIENQNDAVFAADGYQATLVVEFYDLRIDFL